MAIFNMGGGGAGLNYTIEYGANQPLKGNKNIIWIDSDAPVKTYSIENEKIDTYLVQTGNGTAVDNTNFAKFFTNPIINSSYNYEPTDVVSYFTYNSTKDYEIDLHCIEDPVFAIYKATSNPAAENISVELIYPEKIEGSNTYKISNGAYTNNHRILIGYKRPLKEVHCYIANRFFYEENGKYILETAGATVADRTYYYYTKKKNGTDYVDTYEKVDKFLTNTTTLVPTFTLSTRYNKSITYYKQATIPGTNTITYYKVDNVTQENYTLNTYYFISNLAQDTYGADNNLHYQYYNNVETSDGGIALGLPIVKSYTANTHDGESTVTPTILLRCKIASNVISYIANTVQMSYFRCKSKHSYKITNVTKTDANRFFFYHNIVNAPMDGSICSQIPFLQSEIQENTIIKNNLEEDCYIVFSYTAATGVPIFTDVTAQEEFNNFYKESLKAVDVNKNYYMGTSELQTTLGDSLFSDLWIKMGNSSKEESFNLLKKQNDKVQVYPIAVLRKFNLNPLKERFSINIEQSEVWGFMTASLYNANNDEWYTLAQNGDSFDDTRNLLERTIVNLENDDVRFIAPCALYNYATLSKVSFPNCLSVGQSAFQGCSGLNEIYLPKCSFTYGSVSGGADSTPFLYCSNVKKVTLGHSIFSATNSNTTTFPLWVARAKLETVSLPNCITIGQNTFSNISNASVYSSLKEVIAPKLQVISTNAFAYCSALRSINTEQKDTIEVIQNNAFLSCSNLSSINLGKVSTIGSSAFLNAAAKSNTVLSNIDLNNVQTIGTNAFAYCTNLTLKLNSNENNLANAVSIGATAFSNCTSLTAIMAPNCTFFGANPITVAANPVSNCNNLTSISLGEVSGTLPNALFYNKASLNYVNLPKITAITAGAVGTGCFGQCTSLKTAYFNNLSNIGAFTFYNNTALEYINKNDLSGLVAPVLSSIGAEAFENCINLKEVYLPTEATSVTMGASAFKGCTNLNIFSVRNVATAGIQTTTFGNCMNLTYVDLGNYIVNATSTNNKFALPFAERQSLTTFHASNVHLITGNATLSNAPFYNCKALTFARFDKCYDIGQNVFHSTGFKEIITEPMENVSTGLYIPNITTIGIQAFQNCTSLTKARIPVTTINNYAFQNCGFGTINVSSNSSNLTLINTTTIGQGAFQGGLELSEIVLPATLTTIGSNAFSGCGKLNKIHFEENCNLTTIHQSAFVDCGLDKNEEWCIAFPSKLATINASAFAGCEKLCAIVITKSDAKMTLANSNAFERTGLKGNKFTINNSEYNCGIYVPDNLFNAYKAAANNAAWYAYETRIRSYTTLSSLGFLN